MKRRSLVGWLLICTLLAAPASAQELRGRRVSEVLDELRSAGLTFIYNTQIVPRDLRIETEPRARGGVELAREVLAAHGLVLSQVAPGVFAVVAGSAPPSETGRAGDGAAAQESQLEEVVVQTSRYTLATGDLATHTFLTQEQVQEHAAPRRRDAARRATPARHGDQRLFQPRLRCAAASRTRPRSCSTACGCTSRFI